MQQIRNLVKKPLRSSASPPAQASPVPAPVYCVAEPPSDPKEICVQRIDFAQYGLPEYQHKYAAVIDNAFNLEDCHRLYSLTGGSMDDYSGNWEQAQLNAGGDKQYLDTSYRNSGRIMIDDFDIAHWILEKIEPYMPEIHRLEHASRHYGRYLQDGSKKPRQAQLIRLNERLRYLKYVSGSFFKRHSDGLYSTPDDKEASYYTLQIYLTGDADGLEGGATRIFSRKDAWEAENSPLKGPCLDIPPRTGRVLVFEQDNVLHSGEPIIKGVKITIRTDFMYEAVDLEDVQMEKP